MNGDHGDDLSWHWHAQVLLHRTGSRRKGTGSTLDSVLRLSTRRVVVPVPFFRRNTTVRLSLLALARRP